MVEVMDCVTYDANTNMDPQVYRGCASLLIKQDGAGDLAVYFGG